MNSYSNGNEPELRTLVPGDYPAMKSVWEKAGLSIRPSGRESRSEVERQMALDPDMWLGCFVGRELVGIVIGSYDSRKAWMNRLAVLPEHRRKKVARMLITEMESRLRARGFGIFAVLVNDDNEASLSLFREAGYETLEHILYLRKLDSPDI